MEKSLKERILEYKKKPVDKGELKKYTDAGKHRPYSGSMTRFEPFLFDFQEELEEQAVPETPVEQPATPTTTPEPPPTDPLGVTSTPTPPIDPLAIPPAGEVPPSPVMDTPPATTSEPSTPAANPKEKAANEKVQNIENEKEARDVEDRVMSKIGDNLEKSLSPIKALPDVLNNMQKTLSQLEDKLNNLSREKEIKSDSPNYNGNLSMSDLVPNPNYSKYNIPTSREDIRKTLF